MIDYNCWGSALVSDFIKGHLSEINSLKVGEKRNVSRQRLSCSLFPPIAVLTFRSGTEIFTTSF